MGRLFVGTNHLSKKKMAESELRFRRNVKIDDKEESVDLLTLAMKKNAEYTKVRCFILED